MMRKERRWERAKDLISRLGSTSLGVERSSVGSWRLDSESLSRELYPHLIHITTHSCLQLSAYFGSSRSDITVLPNFSSHIKGNRQSRQAKPRAHRSNQPLSPREISTFDIMAPGGRGRGGKFSKPTRGGVYFNHSRGSVITHCSNAQAARNSARTLPPSMLMATP